jgi:hypothetical protein
LGIATHHVLTHIISTVCDVLLLLLLPLLEKQQPLLTSEKQKRRVGCLFAKQVLNPISFKKLGKQRARRRKLNRNDE